MFPLVHQLALAAAVMFLRGEQHQEEVEEERVLLIPERRRKQPQGNKNSRTTTNAELGPEVHMEVEELVATAAMMHENSLLPSEFRLLRRLQLNSRISC